MNQETAAGSARVSPEWFEVGLHHVALGAEIAGVGAIMLGAAVAAAACIAQLASGGDRAQAYHAFRATLARGILLGLEFLVAADIIGTIAVEPTLDNLYVLGLLVAIRTFLSFSLEVEIDGRWPWQAKSG